MTNENKRHLFNGLLVVGCRLLVAGCRLLVVGCCLLVIGCWLLVIGCWLLVVGCRLLVAGLDCPVTRVTQWLAGAHETDILTNNQQPTTDNQQPTTNNRPPTNACGRSRGHASGQGDRNYEARPIFPFRGSDQPFGYPIPRAFA